MELEKGLHKMKVRVEWQATPDAGERLRRVYGLLLKEHKDSSHAEPTIQELLLKGLNIQQEYVPQRTLAHGEGGIDDRAV